MSADYSLVVPAYNEAPRLPATLTRLREVMASLPDRAGELIVTDNHSTDDTAAVARAHGATVVFEPHRQIARSRNAGARAATGRYLFFVDADVLVPPRLIPRSLELLDAGGVCGGGAEVTSAPGTPPDVARLAQFWNRLARTMHCACGAYLFCRRDAFEAVGGFDERLYAAEEIRLSQRLKQWGRRHGQAFRLVAEPLDITDSSVRKVQWFGRGGMVLVCLPLLLCPLLLRTRWACGLWYRRPKDGSR